MNKAIRTILAITITTLFVISCAGKPAVRETPDDSPLPAVEQSVSATTETETEEITPDTEILSVEPVEPDLDYLYPEPDMVVVAGEAEAGREDEMPRTPAGPSEPVNPEAHSVAETPPVPAQAAPETPVPGDKPASDSPPAKNVPSVTASSIPPVRPKPEPSPVPAPAPAVSRDTPASPVDGRAETGQPEPAVMPEPEVAEPVAELWSDEDRVSEPPPPVEQPVVLPSRSVMVPKDGILEVWYPGTGWVYLGDASGLIGVAYETRKIDNRDTLFSFRARKTGSYLLEFSRYDVLTDEFIQDALSVTVTDPVPGKRTTVRAPDFILGLEPGVPETAGEEMSADSVLHDEPVLSGPLSGETVPDTSKKEQTDDQLLGDVPARLAAGDAQGALDLLDRFFEKARTRLDEGWFLRGQAYEANSSSRNIRKALEAYETVISAYPESSRWKDADERVRYIRQFYFRVR